MPAGSSRSISGPSLEVMAICTLVHVRAGRDEELAVVLIMTRRDPHRRRLLRRRRDGGDSRKCEPVPQISRRLGQIDLERSFVGQIQARDRGGGPFHDGIEPLDRRELVRVGGRVTEERHARERPLQIRGDDRSVVERRRIGEAGSQSERPCEPVGRDDGHRRREVRYEPAGVTRAIIRHQQGAREATAEQFHPRPGVIPSRVEVDGRVTRVLGSEVATHHRQFERATVVTQARIGRLRTPAVRARHEGDEAHEDGCEEPRTAGGHP